MNRTSTRPVPATVVQFRILQLLRNWS